MCEFAIRHLLTLKTERKRLAKSRIKWNYRKTYPHSKKI